MRVQHYSKGQHFICDMCGYQTRQYAGADHDVTYRDGESYIAHGHCISAALGIEFAIGPGVEGLNIGGSKRPPDLFEGLTTDEAR